MNEVDRYLRHNIQQYADKFDLDVNAREHVLKNASLKSHGRKRSGSAVLHLLSIITRPGKGTTWASPHFGE